jgi:hypothetical protein
MFRQLAGGLQQLWQFPQKAKSRRPHTKLELSCRVLEFPKQFLGSSAPSQKAFLLNMQRNAADLPCCRQAVEKSSQNMRFKAQIPSKKLKNTLKNLSTSAALSFRAACSKFLATVTRSSLVAASNCVKQSSTLLPEIEIILVIDIIAIKI